MADKNEQTAAGSDITDADILAALEAGEHLPPRSLSPETGGEVEDAQDQEPEEGDYEADDTADQPSGDNVEEEETEAGEQEPEGDKDTGEETEEEGEKEEEQKAPPKAIAEMQKRIDKITAIRHQLEEENATLKTQLSAQAIKVAPTVEDPLADLNTEDEVNDRARQMQSLTSWCYENLDGGEVQNSTGETIELTAKEVRKKLAVAQEQLSVHVPARRQYSKSVLRAIKPHETPTPLFGTPRVKTAKSLFSFFASVPASFDPRDTSSS